MMADRLTTQQRSWNMSRIRSKNTVPERKVRSMLHRLGYRFRLHRRDLPGSPDIVLPKYGTVILVHGCYWHRHTCSNGQVVPRTRTEFWRSKFEENQRRDRSNTRLLKAAGWRVVVVWECQTADEDRLRHILTKAMVV